VKKSFSLDFVSLLSSIGLDQTEIEQPNSGEFIIKKKSLTIFLHLLGSKKNDIHQVSEKQVTTLKVVHIFEDQWLKNPIMVAFRVKNLLGLNQTISARLCEIIKIDKPCADMFFELNHFQGSSSFAFKYGLQYKGELLAAMAYSKSRVMTDSKVLYRSYELIRFANKQGFTVTGGLQKLVKHFIREKHAQHIMTYIDLDWGNGNSFAKMGFKDKGNTPEHMFYIDPKTYRRYSEKEMDANKLAVKNYIAVQNSGSKKMVLDLRTF
jgi:hypothetical protein